MSSFPPALNGACALGTRSKHSKSRSGCRLCKRRRVKCDETAPACTRCVRGGLQCPGYSNELRWSEKYELLRGANRSPTMYPLQNGGYNRLYNQDQRQHVPPRRDRPAISPERQSTSSLGDLSLVRSTRCAASAPSEPSLEQMRLPADGIPSLFSESGIREWQVTHSGADGSILVPNVPCVHGGLLPNHEHDETDHRLAAEPSLAANRDKVGNGDLQFGVSLPLTHLPTYLIRCWFSHICPVWSTFDSHSNYNRRIASMTWSNSGVVYNTLQCMSAAYMMHKRPALMSLLPTMTMQATKSLQEEISHTKISIAPTVRMDLVFAVLAFGTSLHWTHCSLNAFWLNEIQTLLELWSRNIAPLDQHVYAYFSQAVIYWQMLTCLVVDDTSHEGLDCRRRKHKRSLVASMASSQGSLSGDPLPSDSCQSRRGTRPNSWCGVSCEVIDLFGQVLALCRKARRRERTGVFNLDTSCDAICDIRVAMELQMELIALDVQMMMFLDELSGFTSDTGDAATPTSHLISTADACREASLLQLYLTFDDLEIKSTEEPNSGGTFLSDKSNEPLSAVSRKQKLSAFALHITSILQQIPADSGSRSLHPILYLTIAPGLRFLPDVQEGANVNDRQPCAPTTPRFEGVSGRGSSSTATARIMGECDEAQHYESPWSSCSSSQIMEARNFIERRLNDLQNVLPRRPITKVLDLIHTVWSVSDSTSVNNREVHWMDTMMDSSLQTLFR